MLLALATRDDAIPVILGESRFEASLAPARVSAYNDSGSGAEAFLRAALRRGVPLELRR